MSAPPLILYWRMRPGPTFKRPLLLVSVLGPPELVAMAEARDGNGVSANKAVLGRRVPYGAEAWAADERGPWRPLSELPDDWFPKGSEPCERPST